MKKANASIEDRIRGMMHEVEAAAKDLRACVRKRAKEVGLTKELRVTAKQLREGAARAAAMVERYAHTLRMELGGAIEAKAPARKPTTRR
jgi:hypothetical protein